MLYQRLFTLLFILSFASTKEVKAQPVDTCSIQNVTIIQHCLDSIFRDSLVLKYQMYDIFYEADNTIDSIRLEIEILNGFRKVLTLPNTGSAQYYYLSNSVGCNKRDSVLTVTVRDARNPDCYSYQTWEIVCCERAECPIISGPELKAEIKCKEGSGKFSMTIDFDYDPIKASGRYFSLLYGHSGVTEWVRYFKYKDLPVTIEDIKTFCPEESGITLSDPVVTDPHCSIFKILRYKRCCDSTCHLSDMMIERTDCDSSGYFDVFIQFNHSNPHGFFKVVGNGREYGIFKYSQLPIKLHLKGDCRTPYEFVILDNGEDECTIAKDLGVVCCKGDGCELWGLNIEKTHCDSIGLFYAYINFQHQHNGDFFKVVGNGREYGSYNYADLPIKLHLKGDCRTPYEFVILDNGEDECTIAGDLGVVCCEIDGGCSIRDINLRKTECDPDGFFEVFISFKHFNSSEFFDVLGNGHKYGTFRYADIPIRLRLKGDCHTPYEFLIRDHKINNCEAGIDLGKVCCNREDMGCSICDLKTEPLLPCRPNGTFDVLIRASHSGGSGAFVVQINGHNYGSYKYSALPLRIEGLKGDCKTKYKLTIYDKEEEHCGAVSIFGPVCCEHNPCPLDSLLRGDAIECNPDHKSMVVKLFTNLPNTSFDIFTRDSFLLFGKSDNRGVVTISHFPISGHTYEYVKVCINDSKPPCCGEIEFKSLKCANANIDILRLVDDIRYSWVDESLRIKRANSSPLRIQIFSLEGKLALQTQTISQEINIPFGFASPGYYLVRMISGGDSATYSFIKSK